MFKSLKSKLIAGVAVAGVVVSNASAALTAPTLDTTDFTTIAGAVIVALGAMWAVKKALGLIRV